MSTTLSRNKAHQIVFQSLWDVGLQNSPDNRAIMAIMSAPNPDIVPINNLINSLIGLKMRHMAAFNCDAVTSILDQIWERIVDKLEERWRTLNSPPFGCPFNRGLYKKPSIFNCDTPITYVAAVIQAYWQQNEAQCHQQGVNHFADLNTDFETDAEDKAEEVEAKDANDDNIDDSDA